MVKLYIISLFSQQLLGHAFSLVRRVCSPSEHINARL